jgi:hypothetical protein
MTHDELLTLGNLLNAISIIIIAFRIRGLK